jgi:two-component system response regulator MtrA
MAKIVVADDDVDVRMLVMLKLEHAGHDVVGVENGHDAVAACRSTHPDLVVLDLMMPGMSGLDACQEIRSDPALAETSIILLTARAQETDVHAGMACGADAYVTKPFSPRDLALRVDSLLTRAGHDV